MRPSIQVLNPDGTVSPVNDTLSNLMSRIPGIDTEERVPWREEALQAIRR